MTKIPHTRTNLYFDYNATAPLCASAREAVIKALDITGNPVSIHNHGREARQTFEVARQKLSKALKAGRFDSLVFTSGGTESNNIIIKTFQTSEMKSRHAKVFCSSIEHPCVLNACESEDYLMTDTSGVIDLDYLDKALSTYRASYPDAPILISVMMVNNETGVVQPLHEIIRLAKSYDAFVHSDVVQALGRLPFDIEMYPLDYATVSSHKIGGLTGFGALYARAKTPLEPLIDGGGQEKGKRSGTSNLSGAAAFAGALSELNPQKWDVISDLRDHIESEILKFCPTAKIWGKNACRVANTSSIMMPDVDGMTQVMSFDIEGISVSAGSACSSGTVSPSHVLKTMGASDHEANNSIRVSLPATATKADIDHFIDAWKRIYQRCAANPCTTKTTPLKTNLTDTQIGTNL